MLISSPALTANDLLRGDIQLTSPPNVYFALKAVIDDPAKSMADAAIVIESDAALAMRLLKLVNSAFFGASGQISSIAKAISLIGTRELQTLALSMVIIDRFSELPGQDFSMHDFWARSLRCGLIAKELDRCTVKQYGETAFLCGLVHDVGQLVFYRRLPELAREVDFMRLSATDDWVDEGALEEQLIGFDHYQMGAALCRTWRLPDIVIDSIRLHRYPDYVGEHGEIARIVRSARHFSTLETPLDAYDGNGFELPSQQIAEILDSVHERFEVIFGIFYPQR
ncbi:MAG: HDOD domain-containing protein [Methylomonas sp.]|nr:HDOD domain-containing protein [Methylomonas sp.]PPD22413.1 MAG: histidine kinase [Methylomonas sp.]PPD26184.1 MAG: histidine kinase [Methylomonas sp.]PPD37901.1 MAG: histidine kinase [Methylomonas sp.]PPD42095.1 MAG: histidine kinase [Methylomonas sp.]